MAGFYIRVNHLFKKKLSTHAPAFISAKIKVKVKAICVKLFHFDT